jgi:hypothetical protein
MLGLQFRSTGELSSLATLERGVGVAGKLGDGGGLRGEAARDGDVAVRSQRLDNRWARD